MNKLKMAWAFIIAAAVGAFAWLGTVLRRQEEQRARAQVAADLKAKLEAVKAQRDAEKAATAAKVEQVQADAKKEMERDSVELANDLIADARAGSGERSKG